MHRMVVAIIFALACTTAAEAAEVKILTAGAMKAVVLELVPQFEKESGHNAVVDNDTAGGLAKRIDAGEAFDVAVITPGVVNFKGTTSLHHGPSPPLIEVMPSMIAR